MTLPQNVRDAVAYVDEVFDDCDNGEWQTIRAHLMSQEAEIDRLQAGNEWMPIETAPRDGRQMILLLTPSGWPQVAYSNTWWTAGFSVECKPTHWARIHELPPTDRRTPEVE